MLLITTQQVLSCHLITFIYLTLFLVSWYKIADGKLEKAEEGTKYHIEDFETTFCMEVKSAEEVDAGAYLVRADNEAGDVEAEFKLSIKSKL